jgi:uncharacterized protein YegL
MENTTLSKVYNTNSKIYTLTEIREALQNLVKLLPRNNEPFFKEIGDFLVNLRICLSIDTQSFQDVWPYIFDLCAKVTTLKDYMDKFSSDVNHFTILIKEHLKHLVVISDEIKSIVNIFDKNAKANTTGFEKIHKYSHEVNQLVKESGKKTTTLRLQKNNLEALNKELDELNAKIESKLRSIDENCKRKEINQYSIDLRLLEIEREEHDLKKLNQNILDLNHDIRSQEESKFATIDSNEYIQQLEKQEQEIEYELKAISEEKFQKLHEKEKHFDKCKNLLENSTNDKIIEDMFKPTHFILTVDMSGSMEDVWDETMKGLCQCIDSLRQSDKCELYVSIIFFNHQCKQVIEFVPIKELSKNQIEKMISDVKPYGGTIYSVAFEQIRDIIKSTDSRCDQRVIFITDGEDGGSVARTYNVLTEIEELGRNVHVHIVGFGNDFPSTSTFQLNQMSKIVNKSDHFTIGLEKIKYVSYCESSDSLVRYLIEFSSLFKRNLAMIKSVNNYYKEISEIEGDNIERFYNDRKSRLERKKIEIFELKKMKKDDISSNFSLTLKNQLEEFKKTRDEKAEYMLILKRQINELKIDECDINRTQVEADDLMTKVSSIREKIAKIELDREKILNDDEDREIKREEELIKIGFTSVSEAEEFYNCFEGLDEMLREINNNRNHVIKYLNSFLDRARNLKIEIEQLINNKSKIVEYALKEGISRTNSTEIECISKFIGYKDKNEELIQKLHQNSFGYKYYSANNEDEQKTKIDEAVDSYFSDNSIQQEIEDLNKKLKHFKEDNKARANDKAGELKELEKRLKEVNEIKNVDKYELNNLKEEKASINEQIKDIKEDIKGLKKELTDEEISTAKEIRELEKQLLPEKRELRKSIGYLVEGLNKMVSANLPQSNAYKSPFDSFKKNNKIYEEHKYMSPTFDKNVEMYMLSEAREEAKRYELPD